MDRDLLFLGTEFGLWVSIDGGKGWMRWTHGVPTASVMDLAIHPRDHDLVIATHGRALYVLDDITPLRSLTPEALAEPLHLFPAAAGRAVPAALRPGGASRAGSRRLPGENRPYGVLLTYSLNAPGLPLPDEETERERKEKRAEPRRGPDRREAPTGGAQGGSARPRPRSEDATEGERSRQGRDPDHRRRRQARPQDGRPGEARRQPRRLGPRPRRLRDAAHRQPWPSARRRQRPEGRARHLQRDREVQGPRGQGYRPGRPRPAHEEHRRRLAGARSRPRPGVGGLRTPSSPPSTASARPAATSTSCSKSSTPGQGARRRRRPSDDANKAPASRRRGTCRRS